MTDDKGNGDGAGDDKATAKLTTADKELTTADKELLRAATSGDLTGLVALTPERLQEMSDALRERTATSTRAIRSWSRNVLTRRGLVAAWVFKAIVDHARDGGTFRFLIYERLGFGPDAHLPLHEAGGMTISNAFDLKKDNDTEERE